MGIETKKKKKEGLVILQLKQFYEYLKLPFNACDFVCLRNYIDPYKQESQSHIQGKEKNNMNHLYLFLSVCIFIGFILNI